MEASFLLPVTASPPMPVNLPTNLLRSFVAIVDTGSMLSASEQVYVTQSALSLQIKRLEELVQRPLFSRQSRRLALTPAGESLLEYARRILKLHDEAVTTVAAGQFLGPVRVGMVQDFADTLLAGVLAQFSEHHPETQIFARVAGTLELLAMLDRGALDVAVGFGAEDDPSGVRTAAVSWLGRRELAERSVLPLAILEKPCRFREAAIASLEAAGRPFRIAVETPNLSALRAAVEAGLGITCRTFPSLPGLPVIHDRLLPALPDVAYVVVTATPAGDAQVLLAQLATAVLRGLPGDDGASAVRPKKTNGAAHHAVAIAPSA
jgi:DNA-binding transcriptional LysR family regulator